MSKMNQQERMIWEGLSPEVQKISHVTFSHQEKLSIIHERLKDIYGDRADWKILLEQYKNSDDYKKACHKITSIDDVPELFEADICEMIRQSQDDECKIEKLRSLLSPISNADHRKPPTLEMYRAAEILGILPNGKSGLTSLLVDFSNLSETEKNQIDNKISENSSIVSIILKDLIDLYFDGFVESYPQCGTVITQSKRRYYYRGENAFYASSKPSLARGVNLRLPNRIISMLLELRTNEGCLFLDDFDAVSRWPIVGSVNYLSLAQHYGLRTRMMDVTSDIFTALFFACCKYKDGKWYPLDSNEITEKSSRVNIADLGGDSRYAILYRSPTDITDMQWATQDNPGMNIITPIGYQPFMRCTAQYGYMLLTRSSNYDMMQDEQFEKYKIRLSEEFCQWIYKEMDCGEKIYPQKDIPDLSEYFDQINRAKRFSEESFKLMAETFKIPQKEYESTIQELQKYGISIVRGGRQTYIRYKELRKINKNYPAEKAIELHNIAPMNRPMIVVY